MCLMLDQFLWGIRHVSVTFLVHVGYQYTGTLANSEDPDKMQLKTAFRQGLHCAVLRDRNSSFFFFFINWTCNLFKYQMDNSILIVSICMG